MAREINRREAIIVGVAALIVVLGVVGYFVFLRDTGEGGGDNGDDGNGNSRPVADAGYDITVMSGDQVNLSGAGSYDNDLDDLFYYWDMDYEVDSNSDGIKDNDWDLVGMDVTYMYPLAFETITYIVTLNVSDGEISDTDTVRVTILAEDGGDETPELTLSCRYQVSIPYIEAHFLITVDSASSSEMISNFSYRLESAEGDLILNGTISDIVVVPPNATIRFIDSPELTRLGEGDTFSIKEGNDISEGCWFYLFYNLERDPVGEVELIKS